MQFWRLISVPENAVFAFSFLATQFSESLEIFHDIFPDTFPQISPDACLMQSSNAENPILKRDVFLPKTAEKRNGKISQLITILPGVF